MFCIRTYTFFSSGQTPALRACLGNVEPQTLGDLEHATTQFSDADLSIVQQDPNDKWGDVDINTVSSSRNPAAMC